MEPTSPTNTTAAAPGIELETAAAEERFQAFMRIPDQAAMLSFAVEQEDADLDDLERTVAARLAAAQGDEATAIRQRLEGLRRLRSEDLATARAVTAAVAQMSHAERLQLMFETVTDAAGMMGLVAATADDDLDRLEAAAEARIAAAGGEEGLQQRLDDLRRWRTTEQAARATLAPLGEAGGQALADQLVTWIQTPDWDASETFLAAHAAELLTDAGAAALTLLRMNNPGHEAIEQHGPLLAACRQIGVEAAYAQLRRGLAQQAQLERLQQSRLGQAVIAFVQAEDADAAAQLQSQNLLTTTDARDALQMLLDRAIQAGDTPAAARIADRLALVQTARLARYAPPPDPSPSNQRASLGAESSPALQNLGINAEGVKYLVVSAQNCTIGDNGITINNFGVVPLQWRRPEEFQRKLTDRAVGRRQELDDLHRALENGRAAVVGKGIERGTSGALHGLPGVGKSILAALYAEAYAADYPGGVLWLQLTPDMMTAESVGPELSRVAAYAYSMDVQAYRLFMAAQQLPGAGAAAALRGAQFAPEIVRGLLTGHGRLLVVADNAWDRAVLAPMRAALPIDAHLLVTTRDERVAVDVGRRLELDVLSGEDALALIALTLPALPPAVAARLATAVGYHPLALEITVGDLASYGPDEWAGLVAQIESSVKDGLSLDGAPLPDDVARERRLEVVLRYSYDALGRAPDGAALQRCFRGLGCLAHEADFATDAAAALWAEAITAAQARLNVFAARSLLRRQADGRWRQHGILRGFALRLQSAEERERWPERHARHYLAAMQAADDAQRYYVMTADLPNLRQAFAWAQQESLETAQALLSNTADLLRSQNLGNEYLTWADRVLAQAQRLGSSRAVGQALLNRGNALQAAATLVLGEDRGGRLRQALAAYDEALALRRDVPLDYATTQNNRAVLLRDLASLPGEDRGGRLRQALAAYDEALALRRDVPLDYATTQNNRANLLRDLASLPGEDRGGRLRQALAAYDEALALRRDVPLDYATTQNNRANLLRDLASLPGEDRGGRLRQALAAYDKALALLRDVPLDYATTQNNRANLLRDLASLPGEDRGGRLRQALAAYDEALALRRDVPLDYATTQNNRANLLRDLASLPGEDRGGRLRQALAAYDEALALRRDVPLDYATTQNNRANLLSDLASLPGEDRGGLLRQALAAYDEALALRRDVPLDYATTQNNRANLLSDLASSPGEDRGGLLRQALAAYDEALALLRDVPLDYATTQNNRANLLSDLASLPGEDRGGLLRQALAAYDEALALRRDVPLDYATTQNNRANLLSDLASSPGEDRGGLLRQALAAYDEALALRRDVPLDYAQTQNNRAVLLSDLASLPGEDRGGRLRQALQAAGDAVRLFESSQHVQYLEIGRRTLAGVVVTLGVGGFAAAWRQLYPAAELPRLDRGHLLGELAEQEGVTSNEAFTQRLQADPKFKARADELIAFAQEPGEGAAAGDPLAAGLYALLQVDSEQALRQTLADHPILIEVQGLLALAGQINQALADQARENVTRLVILLAVLLEGYNEAHSDEIDPEAHMAVIDLCEQVIPLAGQLDASLATALRQQAAWACNTLGNHAADTLKDLAQAVAAYSRGLAFDPAHAMLLRNRAGVHMDRGDLAAAQADIEAAARLQPDAPRLADLRRALAAAQG